MYKGNQLNANMAWERIWFWNLDSFGVCSFFWETNIAPSQPRFEEDFPYLGYVGSMHSICNLAFVSRCVRVVHKECDPQVVVW